MQEQARTAWRRCAVGMLAGWVLAGFDPAGAQVIYKWVDAQGVTQYTTAPPPAGVAATRITVAPPPPAELASQAKARAQRQIDEANRRAAERQAERDRALTQQDSEQRDSAGQLQRCARAREQLEAVMRGGPVYRYGERGERIYLDDSQRDAEIARLRGAVEAECSAGGAAADAAARRESEFATRAAECGRARDALRDLQAEGTRAPAWQIEQARARVERLCGGPR